MKTISLFAGCGGMDLGAVRSGARIIYANDIMPESRKCFDKYFPNTEFVLGDVSTITRFPSADLVFGGYPCQSFSMGGKRKPHNDGRSLLFKEFAKCISIVKPKFFIAENVSGLKNIESGKWLKEQLNVFRTCGDHGYNITLKMVRAETYGIPQRRKRLFIIGVSKKIGLYYRFPIQTHGSPCEVRKKGLKPFLSHGEIIKNLPSWPVGEFYERPNDPKGEWSWYYMSRNRKAKWDGPSYTIVANLRHTPLHPASPKMELVWSDLKNGWKQRWNFTSEYDHLSEKSNHIKLENPRRLSWRECALIQTFSPDFEPYGNLEKKFLQIGNAVPPFLAEIIITPLINGEGLCKSPLKEEAIDSFL